MGIIELKKKQKGTFDTTNEYWLKMSTDFCNARVLAYEVYTIFERYFDAKHHYATTCWKIFSDISIPLADLLQVMVRLLFKIKDTAVTGEELLDVEEMFISHADKKSTIDEENTYTSIVTETDSITTREISHIYDFILSSDKVLGQIESNLYLIEHPFVKKLCQEWRGCLRIFSPLCE